MIKVIEGRITAAEESNSLGVKTKIKVDLLHPDTENSEGEHRGTPYWYHASYYNVQFHYPPVALGEIYLLTEEMLDELSGKDWMLQVLKEELGEEKVIELLAKKDKEAQ